MNADEKMAARMAAVIRDYEFEQDGETPPPCTRETALADLLRDISEGNINLRDTRKAASDAVETWERRLPSTLQPESDDD